MARKEKSSAINMAVPTLQLTSLKEFTCFEGLKLLQKLLVSGQFVPAYEIKSFLLKAEYSQLVKVLFIAKITNLENAYQFLLEAVVKMHSFVHNNVMRSPFFSMLLSEAVKVNSPQRVTCLLTLHKTLRLLEEMDMLFAVDLAVQLGNVECLRLVLDAWRSERQPSIFRRMTKRELDDDDVDDGNEVDFLPPPLYFAAENGEVECVRLLLDCGFHADGNRYSKTPLYAACECGHLGIVKLLLEAGADIKGFKENPEGPFGFKILCTMQSAGFLDCAKKLLKAGVRVNCYGHGMQTPLHIAASNGLEEIATLLIEHGADLEARDNCGSTPLHCAVMKEREALVRLLIAAGADTCAKDAGGTSLKEMVKSEKIHALLFK